MEDLVQYIVTTLGDHAERQGDVASALAAYSKLAGVDRYYTPRAPHGRYWFSQATAVSTLYAKIRDWADEHEPNFLVLAQQGPPVESSDEIYDILIVDTGT